jgi:molybdopterin-guanine dinucleotide biosynthesis protein MobB
MKIIHIVGESGSGKTTFIESLLPQIIRLGPTATVKHLGEHQFQLEKGKDTTRFFELGATISAGIDSDKTVIAIRNFSLDDTLRILHQEGIEYVILEGFKTQPFPKIVIGNLEAENCVLRNPTINTVLESLILFRDYPGA